MSLPTPFTPDENKKHLEAPDDSVDARTRKIFEDMKAGKIKPPARQFTKAVPTVFKHIIKTEWIRTFDWKERIRILFGGNLVVMMGHATQHNPGVFQPLILGKVTNETSPDAYARHLIETMIEERKLNSPVQVEEPTK